jgi:hypothetical protein
MTYTKNTLSIAKWIVLISKYYSNIDELIETAVNCIDFVCPDLNDLNNQNTNINTMPKQQVKSNKVQCHAAKTDGNRCSLFTTSENKLCSRHQSKTALEWNDAENELVQTVQQLDLSNKIILTKDIKTGYITWPNSNFIVKSFDEPHIIGKLTSNDTCVPLSEDDVEYCEKFKMPYKIQDISFKGEAIPPKEAILRELKKLTDYTVYAEDLEIND